MRIQKNSFVDLNNKYLDLAFELARLNLGKTKNNPSVGCVVVKGNSVISSGHTSLNGRPHVEFNALSKKKKFKDADIYITMEPCTHYGKTPPCTNIIIKKKIKRVFFCTNDPNPKTSNKAKKILLNKGIEVYKINNKKFKDFYSSYFNLYKSKIPFIDAKIALSKDFFSINKKSKWITNHLSRKRAHLIRSEYDCIISTSKTINFDNSILNSRINGFDNSKPDLIIIDKSLNINIHCDIFKKQFKKRNIFIVTSVKKDKKITYLKKKKVKFIIIQSLDRKKDFLELFQKLKEFNYNRCLVESGLKFLNKLLKIKLISNLYLFKSPFKLGNKGKNNSTIKFIKKLVIRDNIKVNLNGDNLYKIKINNV